MDSGAEPGNSHPFYTQLMLQQLLDRGWTPGFHYDVDYDVQAWDRQKRPMSRVDHMELSISDQRHDEVSLRLFDDGMLDIDIERPATRQMMIPLVRHPVTGAQVINDNPLGSTIVYFDVPPGTGTAGRQVKRKLYAEPEQFDIRLVDQVVDQVRQAFARSKRRNRTRTPDV